MIISISKILQDKQIVAAITIPITIYSPLFKSDTDESTGDRTIKHINKTLIDNLTQ